MYISDQKKKKTINEYAELRAKTRNEYEKLQKEWLHKYQNYFQNMSQKLYQKPSYTSNYWEKESTTIKMNLNNVKKLILMLQKFEDVLKNKKRE